MVFTVTIFMSFLTSFLFVYSQNDGKWTENESENGYREQPEKKKKLNLVLLSNGTRVRVLRRNYVHPQKNLSWKLLASRLIWPLWEFDL